MSSWCLLKSVAGNSNNVCIFECLLCVCRETVTHFGALQNGQMATVATITTTAAAAALREIDESETIENRKHLEMKIN